MPEIVEQVNRRVEAFVDETRHGLRRAWKRLEPDDEHGAVILGFDLKAGRIDRRFIDEQLARRMRGLGLLANESSAACHVRIT